MTERERLGKLVRDTWIAWALEQPQPKATWIVPWERLSEADKEVDMRIAEAVRRDLLAEARKASDVD